MNKFRLLRADEIEVRIAQVKDTEKVKGVSLLLYKTARTDANLLDETVGPENWECDFKVVDGVLYGGIGIYFEDKDRWVWKWDAGTESNTEAEKGRASDAFKRAGFKHGIGRELYSAPFVWVKSDKCEIKNGKCSDRFCLTDISYDKNGDIAYLVITNETKGVVAYSMGKKPVKKEAKPEVVSDDKASVEDLAFITSEATKEELELVMKSYKLSKIEDLTADQARKTIKAIKYRGTKK